MISQSGTDAARQRDLADRGQLKTMLEGPIRAGAAIIVLFALVFFVWGGLAPLQAGAFASGQIAPEGTRRTVQHLEGGIIEELLVGNGSDVMAGDPLIVLRPVQARANVDLLEGRHVVLSAQLARLRAEQAGLSRLDFPAELTTRAASVPGSDEVLTGERILFERRAVLFSENTAVLHERIGQLDEKIAGYEAQIEAQSRRRALLDSEIADTQGLVDQGLAPRPRLLALQREQAAIDEQTAGLTAAIAESRRQIGETRIQLQALSAERLERLAEEASLVQSDLMDVVQQLQAGRDVLSRTIVTAPVSGRVTNLNYRTLGGVIQAGAPILDIVPEDEPLVIEARLSPVDIDSVHPGQMAQVHLPALPQRGLPKIEGEVIDVSADALTDETTGAPYFRVRVRVPLETLARYEIDGDLTPGMPAEVVVVTGERTLLDYITRPIRDSMRRALKET